MASQQLIEELRKHRLPAFQAVPIYSPHGDSLTFIFEDTQYYRERIDDFLTVYRAVDSDDLVGCQLKGVPEVLNLLGKFDLTITNSPVKLNLLFLSCMTRADKEFHRFYVDLGEQAAARKAELSPASLRQMTPPVS